VLQDTNKHNEPRKILVMIFDKLDAY